MYGQLNLEFLLNIYSTLYIFQYFIFVASAKIFRFEWYRVSYQYNTDVKIIYFPRDKQFISMEIFCTDYTAIKHWKSGLSF